MSWLNVDLNKLEKEEKRLQNELLEPGVYKVTIPTIFINTTKSGAEYFCLDIVVVRNGDYEVHKFHSFSVERMIRNKEGSTKTSNGRYFTGIILLNKIARCNGLTISDLRPREAMMEIFGEQKKVKVIEDFFNKPKPIMIGIRHRIREYEGNVSTNLEIVDICCVDDEGNVKRLKKRIEKKPVIDETTKETKKEDEIEVPF